MSVPEQVRKQTEAVQKLYDDLNPNTSSPDEGEGAGELIGVQPVVADSVEELAPATALIEPSAEGQENPNSETYEQRWRTAQGMYNAEVPRLTQENTHLGERVTQLESLISTMSTVPAPESVPAPAPASALTETEVEEYGESIDIMRKVSQEIIGPYQDEIVKLNTKLAQLQGQVIPQIEQLGHAQAQTADQNFWGELTRLVPDWQKVNAKQDFQSWLLEADMLSGMTRQTFLEDAQRQLDSERVAGFFTSWLSISGTETAQPNRAASELEKQVSPGRSNAGGAVLKGEPKTYTPAAITKFFNDVRDGKFKGKEDKRNAIEHDIFAAQAEGRIINA